MPVKSANIDFQNKKTEDKPEKTEKELRKEAMNQIFKDGRRFIALTGKFLLTFIFIYGLVSLLQDVNLI